MNEGGPGRRVIDGRFELGGRLGGGGMGWVWHARDLVLHRDVAVKEVRPTDPGLAEYDPQAAQVLRERVLREARALARVHHPNVVTIHHIVDGGPGTYPWLVMELVTGGSLQDRIEKGAMTPVEAARLGREVLSALRAAHAVGIEHRDVKPANVLLRPDGRPVLTDFGIAASREFTSLTATGSVIGSPDYMAPERVGGKEGGPASDLWSLAMLLYVAVEGHHPMRRDSTLATLAAVLSEEVPPPRQAGPLTGMLNAVLVKDPLARPDAETIDRMLAAVETAGATHSGVPAFGAAPTSYQLAAPAPAPAPAPPAPGPWSHPASAVTVGAPYGPSAHTRTRSPRNRAMVTSLAGLVFAGVLVWTQLPDQGSSVGGGAGSSTASQGGGTAASSAKPSGSSTSDSDDSEASTTLLTAEGLKTTVAKFKAASGGSTITSLTIYEDNANAECPVKGSTKIYDRFSYQAGADVAVKNGPGGTVMSGTVPVDLDDYDWDAVPELFRKADKVLNVPNPTLRYLVVTPPSSIFDTEASMSVYLSDDYGAGYLKANVKGEVIDTYPREN